MDKMTTEKLGAILASEEDGEAKECPVPKTMLPEEMPYAMAYVPFQKWEKVYDPEAGLERGTVFPCLDKPFIGEGAGGLD